MVKKNKKLNAFNYENEQYLKKLDELDVRYYSKFIKYIGSHLKNKKSKYLDVGCGNGVVLKVLHDQGFTNGYGIDVSKLFIKDAKKKGLKNLYVYNGKKLPFADNSFDLIASFNVLEHTEEPEQYLQEQVSKLKKGGSIIVACPNFLSVLFPSYHHRLKGLENKSRNLRQILIKMFISKEPRFERMKPIIRKVFQYDDDAIVVTNILDLRRVLEQNNCTVTYESGFINYDAFHYRVINAIPFLKYLLPSCFVVAKKNK